MVPELVPEIVPETVPAHHEELDDEQGIEDRAPVRRSEHLPVADPAASHRAAASESYLDDLESRVLRRCEGRVGPALSGAATLPSAEHATAGGRLGPSLECDRDERQRARPHAGGARREPGLWRAIRASANESGVRDRDRKSVV